jgi:hypothetical protein
MYVLYPEDFVLMFVCYWTPFYGIHVSNYVRNRHVATLAELLKKSAPAVAPVSSDAKV